jgi:hypothetical protein
MKIDEVLNQFRIINLEVKYLKGNYTGIDIDYRIKGYEDFLRNDLCNLSLIEIENIDNKLLPDLFKKYAALSSIVNKYIKELETQLEYRLDELFTDLQEHFTINGIGIDKYNDKFLYDLINKQGEREFLLALKEIFHYNRVSWLRELRVKIDQQKNTTMSEESIQYRDIKFTFASFPKGDNDILPFYQRQLARFKFRTSDIASIDGDILTDIERELILHSCKPIEGNYIIEGEPSEKLYIESTTEKLSKIKLQIPDLKLMSKVDRYLTFLEQRKHENNKSDKQPNELNYRRVALIYQYENWPLTESIAAELIKEGTYPKIKSAKKLATEYRKFNIPTQRYGEGFQTANDIRTILPFLSNKAKLIAVRELQQALVNQRKKNIE